MPFDQTITIINNSGKVISTGKHLVNIFKEAKAAYREKKESLRQESRDAASAASGVRRAHTFAGPVVEEFDDGRSLDDRSIGPGSRRLGGAQRFFLEARGRMSVDGGDRDRDRDRDHDRERALIRTRAPSVDSYARRLPHRSSSVGGSSKTVIRRFRPGRKDRDRPPLTEHNLRAHSEVSSTAPSAPPIRAYNQDRLAVAEQASRAGGGSSSSHHAAAAAPPPGQKPLRAQTTRLGAGHHMSMLVHRRRSDPSLRETAAAAAAAEAAADAAIAAAAAKAAAKPATRPTRPERSFSRTEDMHLAYGDIPPDLLSRDDLDPPRDSAAADAAEAARLAAEKEKEKAEARNLIDYIEAVLNEAQCIHYTATTIISHLQGNPEAAAAVALTLAELSGILAKLSPAFLAVIKGGSPAVFALLACPQFLIGTSIAAGITVVVFGGWKIIKRMTESKATALDNRQAFAANPQSQQQSQPQQPQIQNAPGARGGPPSEASAGYDEALVIEEQLSAIESWRRGIVQVDEIDGSVVDAELISPIAMRSRTGGGDDDEKHGRRHSHSHRSNSKRSPEKHSSSEKEKRSSGEKDRTEKEKEKRSSDRESSDKEKRSSSDKEKRSSSDKEKRSSEKEKRSSGDKKEKELVLLERKSSKKAGTVAPSEAGSNSTRRSRRSEKHAGGDGISTTGGGDDLPARKENMLRQLFKKKRDKEDRGRSEVYMSVMA